MTLGAVIFDLDGTLVDSASGILSSFDAAFKSQGITPKKALNFELIGPPLRSIMCQLADSDAPHVIESLISAFKLHYDLNGYQEIFEYASSKPLLAYMAQCQLPVFLATNKRKVPTDLIIEMLQWRRYFQGIYSLDSVNPTASNKGALIQHILHAHALSPMTTLYIGDRLDDAEAANAAGVQFFHAVWGYERASELKEIGAGSLQALMDFISAQGFS